MSHIIDSKRNALESSVEKTRQVYMSYRGLYEQNNRAAYLKSAVDESCRLYATAINELKDFEQRVRVQPISVARTHSAPIKNVSNGGHCLHVGQVPARAGQIPVQVFRNTARKPPKRVVFRGWDSVTHIPSDRGVGSGRTDAITTSKAYLSPHSTYGFGLHHEFAPSGRNVVDTRQASHSAYPNPSISGYMGSGYPVQPPNMSGYPVQPPNVSGYMGYGYQVHPPNMSGYSAPPPTPMQYTSTGVSVPMHRVPTGAQPFDATCIWFHKVTGEKYVLPAGQNPGPQYTQPYINPR